MKVLLIPMVILSLAGLSPAQTVHPVRYVPAAHSRLWLEGTSSVQAFTCVTFDIRGSGSLEPNTISQPLSSRVNASVIVSVSRIDCGNEAMNKDMYRALRADVHPFISFNLKSADSHGRDASGWLEGTVKGDLTVAGVTNTVEIPVRLNVMADGKVRLVGSKRLSMRSFAIEPPTALFGLIRAHDELVVRFDIVVEPVRPVAGELTSEMAQPGH